MLRLSITENKALFVKRTPFPPLHPIDIKIAARENNTTNTETYLESTKSNTDIKEYMDIYTTLSTDDNNEI